MGKILVGPKAKYNKCIPEGNPVHQCALKL